MSISRGFAELPADDRALVEMQVIERVDDARDVVQVLGRRVAVRAAAAIDDVHGRAGGAEIDARPPRLHVVLRVLAVQHEAAARACERVLDERARKHEPARGCQARARTRHVVDARRRRVGEADLLEHVERGPVDAQDVGVGERLVRAAATSPASRGACRRAAAPRAARGAPRARRGGSPADVGFAHERSPKFEIEDTICHSRGRRRAAIAAATERARSRFATLPSTTA